MLIAKLLVVVLLCHSYSSCPYFINWLYPEVCCEVVNECFSQKAPYNSMLRPACPSGYRQPVYLLWTRNHTDLPTPFSIGSEPKDTLYKRNQFYFVVHGWLNSVETPWVASIKDELLIKDDANVILVNWRYLSNQLVYYESVSNTRSAGAHIAKVINGLRQFFGSAANVWCIGHSLGAHVCGQAGRRSHINRITGLDPAGPFFNDNPEIGLNCECADFVDVIHTNDQLGIFKPIGNADFYPNGGRSQPYCLFINKWCDHVFAFELMIASVNNACLNATSCNSYEDLETSCEECPNGDCAQMGYGADPGQHGIFYLKTGSIYPFCQVSPKPSFPYNIINYFYEKK